MKKINPKLFKDKRGFFTELLRTKKLFKQISFSEVKKGVIKGWHGHYHQLQWTIVLKGNLNILIKKKNKIKKIRVKNKIFGYLLKKKELHAYKVLSKNALVLYLTSGFFSPKKDEYRIKMNNEEIKMLNL